MTNPDELISKPRWKREMHPNSLANLRMWDKETAKIAGSAPKDPRQLAINRLVTGSEVKHPDVKKAIMPTPQEKIMGITKSDKIMQLKKLNRLFGADIPEEHLEGLQEVIAEAYIEILCRKKEHNPILNDII